MDEEVHLVDLDGMIPVVGLESDQANGWKKRVPDDMLVRDSLLMRDLWLERSKRFRDLLRDYWVRHLVVVVELR